MRDTHLRMTSRGNFCTSVFLIRWDVKGGNDRDHYPGFDTWQPLDGTPNIQGFTCRSPVNLWLYLDDERQQFSGPTEGKIKINPRRISKYKIVRR
ncbi:hypothetical protein FPSE_04025 [Fusarium pseudograminearum CS3096]|uniref:Uncharacterized protein n=1 Tax=Fusarium pseudograminearum (strain CS3096) TaxID=1028729 RepID=K3W1G2_FUSPC|nr:hypothetical protein FPSE_04025 [Fusarium pseudograminearum CS3096]EKJ75845.1 hypothetical protein FPSE_04025 [Fusarium pseudograminearum CS3096]